MSIDFINFLSVEEKADVLSGTGSIDVLPAFKRAIAATFSQGDFVYPACGVIKLPAGKMLFGDTLVLDSSVHIVGHSAGQAGGNWASTIVFPSDTNGIIVKKGQVNPFENGGDGSIIEGIFLSGGRGSSGHGIWLQGRAKIRDCYITNFAENGINIVADSGSRTNANNWIVDTASSNGNGGHGIYVQGGDTNAGCAQQIDVSGNGGWGILDESFLGNTYIACHASVNVSGAYKSSNPNARCLFFGCYSEGGQNPSEIQFPSMVIGGLHGAGVKGTGVFALDGGFDKLKSNNGAGNPQIGIGTGAARSGDKLSVLSLSDPVHDYWPIVLKWGAGRWRWLWANLDAGEILSFFTHSATKENGYQRDLSSSCGGIGLPKGYYGKGMKYRGEASSIPIDGEWLRGDVLWNESPVAGGNAGWICVEGGTPGTWKTFGAISA